MPRLCSILAGALLVGLLLTSCSDNDSGPAAPPVDLAPPAAPTDLVACDAGDCVKLAWYPNTTDPDLAGYIVYRLAFGQTWRLTNEPITESHYMDPAPLPGVAIYAVSAVDEAGNESACTDLCWNEPLDLPDRHRP